MTTGASNTRRKPAAKPKRAVSPRYGQSRDIVSRDRLLNAAIGLFARFGYDPVSTSAIAAEAGLTQSMVHYHFHSKINLWQAAINRSMHDRAAHFWVNEHDLLDLDPLSQLKVLTRRFMLASAHDAYIARIAVHEAMQRSPRLSWLMERYIGATYRMFDRTIEQAIEHGQIKQLPVGDITTLLLTASAMPFVADAWTEELYGYRQTSREHATTYIETMMEIVFAGLAPVTKVTATHANFNGG